MVSTLIVAHIGFALLGPNVGLTESQLVEITVVGVNIIISAIDCCFDGMSE